MWWWACALSSCLPNLQLVVYVWSELWSSNVQGVLTETTAELAASLSLAAARRIVEADEFMRAGLYDGWLPNLWGCQYHDINLFGRFCCIFGETKLKFKWFITLTIAWICLRLTGLWETCLKDRLLVLLVPVVLDLHMPEWWYFRL